MALFLLVIGVSLFALIASFGAMIYLNKVAERNDRRADPTTRSYDQGA